MHRDSAPQHGVMYLDLESKLISSPCPLLPTERADEYLPSACMVVPKNSAWVSMQINLADYLTENHGFDSAALESALCVCVDNGDRRHDEMQWPEPLIEYDSWLNRRLAIALRGWGDVVQQRDSDPQSITVLRELEELALWACDTLHARSRTLANGSNWCPALDEAGARVLRKDASKRWNRRWKRAIADVAIRHRNLTSMSPWDVFPSGSRADMRFADLLPVTRFADSLSFQCDIDISHWNASNFKRFRERVAAQVRCNGGAGLIAKQV
ncbi:MAG: hypothetical protein AAFN50_12120 [Pseudomonadota bacterium]